MKKMGMISSWFFLPGLGTVVLVAIFSGFLLLSAALPILIGLMIPGLILAWFSKQSGWAYWGLSIRLTILFISLPGFVHLMICNWPSEGVPGFEIVVSVVFSLWFVWFLSSALEKCRREWVAFVALVIPVAVAILIIPSALREKGRNLVPQPGEPRAPQKALALTVNLMNAITNGAWKATLPLITKNQWPEAETKLEDSIRHPAFLSYCNQGIAEQLKRAGPNDWKNNVNYEVNCALLQLKSIELSRGTKQIGATQTNELSIQ